MRALDCLKKEDAPNAVNDRRDALHALLKMVQSEYAAFKPFVTLLAPTCVKVAEMDSDGVCRFYARRVLFQAFQSASYDEFAIVDAVTSLVPIFVDQKVMFLERLILGGGSRSAKIVLKPQELRKIPSVRVIEHLSLDQSAEKGR